MVGIGLSYSNMMTTGMNALHEDAQSDGNAVFNTLQQFSGAVATSLVAIIINLIQDHTTLNYRDATTLGSKVALGVLLFLLIISFIQFIHYLFSKKEKHDFSYFPAVSYLDEYFFSNQHFSRLNIKHTLKMVVP